MIPLSAFSILVMIALLLVIVSFFTPQYPLLAVAVLLIAVALLIGGVGHPPLVR
jgi:hypothetical protein